MRIGVEGVIDLGEFEANLPSLIERGVAGALVQVAAKIRHGAAQGWREQPGQYDPQPVTGEAQHAGEQDADADAAQRVSFGDAEQGVHI